MSFPDPPQLPFQHPRTTQPLSNNIIYFICIVVILIIVVLILVIIGVIPISSTNSNSSVTQSASGTGSSGASGLKGATGAPGAPGTPGIQGIQGIQGIMGLRGPPVKVTYYNFKLTDGGSQAIYIKKETNNGYFMVLCPETNQISVFLLNNYNDGQVGAIFGKIPQGGIGFDFYQKDGDNIKIWYHHLGGRTAHIIAHWWD